MQTAEEFFQDPQPNFSVGETVHLGVRSKHDHHGFVGKLEALDLENDEAVIIAKGQNGTNILRGPARNLSKLH